MSYGRIGSAEEIETAREILANLIWSPFNPSSDNQLLPIRKLELTKKKLKVQADSKLSDEERAKQVTEFDARRNPTASGNVLPPSSPPTRPATKTN